MSRAPRSVSSPAAWPPPNGSAVELTTPPPTTAIGALLNHITGGHIESIDAGPRSFQPMNVNFGLFPPIVEPRVDEAGKRLRGPERGSMRKRALSARAEEDLASWIEEAGLELAPVGGRGSSASAHAIRTQPR